MTRTNFDTRNFGFADLSGLHLQGCAFQSCRPPEASLIDTDLSQATLLGCALDRVEWDRARLRKADLRGSNLSRLNLAALADHTVHLAEDAAEQRRRQVGPGHDVVDDHRHAALRRRDGGAHHIAVFAAANGVVMRGMMPCATMSVSYPSRYSPCCNSVPLRRDELKNSRKIRKPIAR